MNPGQWQLFGVDIWPLFLHLRLGAQQLLWGREVGLYHDLSPPIQTLNPPFADDGAPNDHPIALPQERFKAVILPEALCLCRDRWFAESLEPELDAVMSMETAVDSPFATEDTCSGWSLVAREPGQIKVVWAICSRQRVNAYLAEIAEQSPDMLTKGAEIWADFEGHTVTIAGFGEHRRREVYIARLKNLGLKVGVAYASILFVLFAFSWGAELRQQSWSEKLSDVQSSAALAARVRERLDSGRSLLEEVNHIHRGRNDYLFWLHRLAEITPDSVYLNRIDFSGDELTIRGLANNAAEYFSSLADNAVFDGVESTSAFTRDRASGQEVFTIQLKLGAAGRSAAMDTAVREGADL